MPSASLELKNQIVRAGAGAGKTTALVSQVLSTAESFLQKGKNPKIVVTTFTRKATQELRERLLLSALEKNNQALIDFVKSPSQLHISTIHGVLTLFLSQQGSAIGLAPQFKIVSHSDEQLLYKRKLRDLMRENETVNQDVQSLLELTSFENLLSSLRNFCEALLYAGAGKAFSTADLKELKQQEEDGILSLAKELASRIRLETDKEAWLILASYLESLSLTKNFDPKAMPATRNTKDTVTEETVEMRGQIKKKMEGLSSYRFQEGFFQTHENMTAAFARLGQLLAPQVLTEKIKSSQITMADLENLSQLLLVKSPEAAKAFAEQWDYWLIDEFQDTSPLQVDILRGLIQERKRYIVGDPQQSIYLFRGARSEVFTEMEKEIVKMGGERGLLMKNYRSQPKLLEFFNHYFTRLSSQFQPMEVGYNKDVKSIVAKPGLVYVINSEENEDDDTHSAEYDAVLHRIQELVKAGASFESICVLGRDNIDLQKLAHRAAAANIPIQLHSAGQFFDRPEIRDALSLLKFLVNPHDNLNFLCLLRSPWFFLEDQSILEFCQPKVKSYWVEALKTEHEIIQKLKAFLENRQSLGVGTVWFEALIAHGLFDYCQLADPTGRREANLWKLVTLLRREERKSGFNYIQFITAHETDLSSEESSNEGDATPVVEPRRVSLMTVHASKGLQFDHVIVFRMGKDKVDTHIPLFSIDEDSKRWTLALPDPFEQKMTLSLAGVEIKRNWNEREEHEKDRVLYVAMTRAIQSITLVWNQKKKPRSWAARSPLDFIKESDLFDVREGLFKPVLGQQSQRESPPLRQPWKFEEKQARRVISVTALLGEALIPALNEKIVNEEPSLQAVKKALHGVDVHRQFENMRYSDGDLKQYPELSKYEDGLLLRLIKTGHVEWGFGVSFQNYLIQGQIDLWGEDEGVIWVVDYKTGSERYKDKAFSQLSFYAWALFQMGKIKSGQEVRLSVVYPGADKIFTQKALSMDQITAQIATALSSKAL